MGPLQGAGLPQDGQKEGLLDTWEHAPGPYQSVHIAEALRSAVSAFAQPVSPENQKLLLRMHDSHRVHGHALPKRKMQLLLKLSLRQLTCCQKDQCWVCHSS